MYTTASGAPIPTGTDAFNPPAQFKAWADWTAKFENRVIVPTETDRLNLVAPVRRKGVVCYVEATNREYTYNGTTWESAAARGRLRGIKDASVTLASATFNQLTTGLELDYTEGVTVSGGALTIVTPGKYRVRGGYVVVANGTGVRNVYITKNSAAVTTGTVAFGTAGGHGTAFVSPSAEGVVDCVAGDVLRMIYYQDSGTALALRTLADTWAGIYFEAEAM